MGKSLYISTESNSKDHFEFSINFWNVVFNDCYGYVEDILSKSEIEAIKWVLEDASTLDEYGDPTDEFLEVPKDPVIFSKAICKLYLALCERPQKYMTYAGEGISDQPACENYKRDFLAIQNYCTRAEESECSVLLFGYY
ncbi:hypothetical protein [Marinagarivorans cellulosilyticus]|uniref:Uncharacterized protein n=1 Tax=Marinagarivorans cellulosilyticus TaxID=2721545 RepID=A0AAN1WH02_9GAMM|nr:hypothetical protein [Marinagarivorans cellulosilyticus]BCD97432.1 hypothetical protein MARGE09_P1633 [Marinagarivorans cellulosilyticus]